MLWAQLPQGPAPQQYVYTAEGPPPYGRLGPPVRSKHLRALGSRIQAQLSSSVMTQQLRLPCFLLAAQANTDCSAQLRLGCSHCIGEILACRHTISEMTQNLSGALLKQAAVSGRRRPSSFWMHKYLRSRSCSTHSWLLPHNNTCQYLSSAPAQLQHLAQQRPCLASVYAWPAAALPQALIRESSCLACT